VIAALQCDAVFLAGLADRVVVMRDIADRGIDGIGAAQREIHMLERSRTQFHQFLRQQDGRFGAEVKIAGGIRQPRHLFGRYTHDAVLTVTGIDAPQPRKGIQQFLALMVGQIDAAGRLQNGGADGFMFAKAGDRMNKMIAVDRNESGGLHGDEIRSALTGLRARQETDGYILSRMHHC